LKHKYFTTHFLILILASLSCRLALPASDIVPTGNSPTPVPVQVTVQAATAIPATPQLTANKLKNAQYQLGAHDDHAVIQLTNGKYQKGTDATTLDYASIILTDFVALGDLNGDGVNEAAAILFENYGGTGDFSFLAIYTNVNDLPVFLSSTIIDDRPNIKSMTIENGEVQLDATIHGFQDPGCCPALPTTRRYALVNNQLRLMNYTTATPDGTNRSIEIMSPANGTQSTDSVQVNGVISAVPFENTLSYFIYDEAGNQLAKGSFTVNAPDAFSNLISLAGIPAGTTVYIEIQDLSAADGSLLAMDAVKLVVK
jgi:hypothetical protein